MDSPEPHIQTQTMQKANSSEFLTCFEAEGENYLSRTITAYETGSIILNCRQKGNPWKSTKFKVSISRQGHDNCLLGLWGTDSLLWMSCWVRRQSTLTPTSETRQSSGSVLNEFGITRIQKKSCFSMIMQGRIQVWKLGKPSQNLVGHVIPSTLQLWSSNFWFPSIWSPDGCNPRYKFEIDEDEIQIVITWLREQHNSMVLTRHTHTCSLLAQGHRSGLRLHRNTGYGVKPSLFVMFNFHDLQINIYRKKEGIIFWATLI